MSISYAAKILSRPSHLNYKVLYRNQNAHENYRNSSTQLCPIAIKIVNEYRKLTGTQDPVFTYHEHEIPPWYPTALDVNTSLASMPKNTTPHATYIRIFRELCEQHSNHQQIYTDGSKTNTGVGCAFFINGEAHSAALSPICSIFTAELYAIYSALQHCQNIPLRDKPILLCTDSLSAILSLNRTFNRDPMIQAITDITHKLRDQQCPVTILWVPSHAGIPGNHEADQAATNATQLTYENQREVRTDDLLKAATEYSNAKWQAEWSRCKEKLQQIKTNVGKWNPPPNLTRREQVVISRLRIGHTCLTHQYMLTRDPAPTCQQCDTRLTVKHILEECPTYERYRLSANIYGTVNETLQNNEEAVTNILSFLKSTNLYNAI